MKIALTAALALAIITPAAAQTGSASWYALDGNMTASGERMNSSRMTAAHRKLPFGTKIKVTNLHNNRSVIVRVNDRGPFAKGRILDVSKGAARKLGFIGRGHAKVRIQRVSRNTAVGVQPQWPQLKKLARIALPTKRPATMVASPDEIVVALAGS
ncbi:rare lipoprotein A [Ahrensia sp. R2A130]|nr:rare lipoprotein A [Ahrensia sp. R2A130]